MARFNTVSVETGTITVTNAGTKSVVLESEFLNTPIIYISPGSTESDTIDPGSATKASWNSNAYVTSVSNSAGSWTFTINTEELLGQGDYDNEEAPPDGIEDADDASDVGDTYANIKLVYRAIGPVSAV